MKKRIIAVLLLLALLLSGCGEQKTVEPTPSPVPTAVPTEAPAETAPPTPAPTPDRSISLAKAFRDESLTEGSLTPEEIAFGYTDADGKPVVENVPRTEVWDWWNAQETLPRTTYFEQLMPESLHELYPVLDYAVAHSYSRFCLPTTEMSPTDVGNGKSFLIETYRINNNGISAEAVGTFDLGDGKALRYILVKLSGMDERGTMSEYQESIARAREIVAEIPEGSGDYEKMLFLYQWLTENVRYDFDEYYESEWNLLYDTLIKNKTVCAGYTEALYVMANLAGVECFTVGGNMNSPDGWESHIWNVAKVDGDYYLFDSTWDAGLPPERWCFFGVSEATMQSYYPRTLWPNAKDRCPPCTKDLPIPGAAVFPEGLTPGSVEGRYYSQPYVGLQFYWNNSWKTYTRSELNDLYYGGEEATLEELFDQGVPYTDLQITRGDGATVVVHLISVPAVAEDKDKTVCYSPEEYLDAMLKPMRDALRTAGLRNVSTERSEMEFAGRSYAALTLSGSRKGIELTELTLCTQEQGCFVKITVIVPGDAEAAAQLLNKLLIPTW